MIFSINSSNTQLPIKDDYVNVFNSASPSKHKYMCWPISFEVGAASECGNYHAENEDSYLLTQPTPSLIAVADGVGGGAQGKLASSTLIKCISELTSTLLVQTELLQQWLHNSDAVVAREISLKTSKIGASTFVAAAPDLGGRLWHLTWAGDCRAYLITSNGCINQLTLDDTYANLNEALPLGAKFDDPSRMVGSGAVDFPNQKSTEFGYGEVLLLCSDGIHKYVADDQILSLMHEHGSLQARCQNLVAKAHANGGRDDATAVAIECSQFMKGKFTLVTIALLIVTITLMLTFTFLA